MITIYYASNENRLDDDLFQHYLETIPVQIKSRILKFHRWQDAQASLFGKLLLKKALEDLQLYPGLSSLKYTEYGRPYIEENIEFSISHSGNYVVCAISPEAQIGADLEMIQPVSVHDFKNLFHAEEWKAITGSEDLYWFYYYWTAKEAIVKAAGKGLSIPFKSIYVNGKQVMADHAVWHLNKISFADQYVLQIASAKKIPAGVTLRKVDLQKGIARYESATSFN